MRAAEVEELRLFTVPEARAADPATSHAAAAAIASSAGAGLDDLRECFRDAGRRGLTDDELCARLPRRYAPTVKSARSRLAKLGEVVPTDETRLSARGRSQIVWRIPC